MTGPLAVLVDDDEDSRFLAGLLLRRAGYDVAEFRSGEAALGALARLRPALVLFDFRLRGMNGVSFVDRARRLPGCERAALVSVTGSVMPEQRDAVLRAGAAAVVSKPIDTRTFVTTLERAMAAVAG